MQQSKELSQTMSVSQAKRSRKALLALVETGPVLLTHRRKPVAVVVAYEDWEATEAERVTLKEEAEKVGAELSEAKGEGEAGQDENAREED